MKFTAKITLAVTVLLAVALSAGGFFLVRQNFREALAVAAAQNNIRHLTERYALENHMVNLVARSEPVNDENLKRYAASLTGYLGDGGRIFALYTEGPLEIYDAIPEDIGRGVRHQAVEAGEGGYFLQRVEDEVYMLMASEVRAGARGVSLLNAYPVTYVFAERQSQLAFLLRTQAVILVLATVLVYLLARRLTRPIRRLNLLSRRIAAGAYSARTRVETGDEIGELSRNFDLMAQAVEEKVEELNGSLQSRDDFVSAFTHEIKTPMTSIIGYSDIMRSMESEPAVRQRAANYIYHEAKRLEALSQKLLALMGISRDEVSLGVVELREIFVEIARSVAPALGELRLEVKSPGELRVRADRELAGDLLRNLLVNAVKAAPADGVVRVDWALEGSRVRVSVLDRGCGIPEEELARITEPFYMVDKSRARKQGGSGIGLALCQRIAHLHGGGLEIESRLGEGTRVSFTLALEGKE